MSASKSKPDARFRPSRNQAKMKPIVTPRDAPRQPPQNPPATRETDENIVRNQDGGKRLTVHLVRDGNLFPLQAHPEPLGQRLDNFDGLDTDADDLADEADDVFRVVEAIRVGFDA